jgi:hypothetical protein
MQGKQQFTGVYEFIKVNKIEGWNEDIICYRDAEGIHTNVPRAVLYVRYVSLRKSE